MTWTALFPALSVFPLHLIVDGACGCPDPNCKDVGKHPDGPWGDIEAGEKRRSPHHPKAGYGIATGARSGIFVVDCDGPEGHENFKALGPCPPTFTVRRGQGRHYYFKYPGARVPNTRSLLAPKVDTRGDGGYIVAPGSPHKSGDRYVIEHDIAPADAPDWLLSWITSASPPPDAVHWYDGDVEGQELAYHERIYREYLETEDPCVQGQGGDAQLWRVVQYGAYDLALPADVVLECLREVFDPRCEPPWGEELERKALHKIRCAKENSTRPPQTPVPLILAELEPAPSPPPVPVEAIAKAPPATDDELAAIESELRLTWGEWNIELHPPRYIVQDVVPFDTVGMIVAKGSSLKTWMALSIGIAVATGNPWLGTFPVEYGPVLIVDFESGQWQLRNRAKQLGADSTPGLGHANFPGGRVDDPGFWVKMGKVCKARGVRLVVVDSFAAGAPGVDENDAKAALPLTLAARFTDACACSVVFIHHAKKGDGGDERDLVRGTGAIYAALDWAVTMIPLDDDRTRMKVRNIKPWGPRPEDFQIALTKEGTLILDENAAGPSPAAAGKDIESALLAVLVRPIANKDLIAKALGKRKADVSAYVDALEQQRKIVKLPVVGYVLDSDEARIKRVQAATETPHRALGALAKSACVDEAFLQDLFRKGRLVLSGRQYLLVD